MEDAAGRWAPLVRAYLAGAFHDLVVRPLWLAIGAAALLAAVAGAGAWRSEGWDQAVWLLLLLLALVGGSLAIVAILAVRWVATWLVGGGRRLSPTGQVQAALREAGLPGSRLGLLRYAVRWRKDPGDATAAVMDAARMLAQRRGDPDQA
jgi:hypothetical protein